jgi:uncharacterized protein with NRDE domain
MCVIVLFFRVHPQLPLVVAANRDEYYARASSGPLLLNESPRVVGGRDLERGGTWMGFAEGGLFVGLTNQRTVMPRPPEPARRSRGEVVTGALRAASIGGVEQLLASTDARAYNPYNLLFGDARQLRVAYAREGDPTVRVHPLEAGLYVLDNDTLGTTMPKVMRAEALARPLAARPWFELFPALHAMLADHAMPEPAQVPAPPAWMDPEIARRLQSLCVHTPAYGTRSATIAAVGVDGVMHYRFAPGPPCQTSFIDATSLLATS